MTDTEHRDAAERGVEAEQGALVSTRRAALALLGSVGGVGLLSASSSGSTEPEGADPDSESGSGPAAQTEEPDLPAGTEALVQFLEAKYGDALTQSDLEELRGDVAGNLRAAREMDDVELANSTGPAFTFRAYRGEE